MSDRCGSCDLPRIGGICKECGFCQECAMGAIDEAEGLCETCLLNVAYWAIYRARYLEGLLADQPGAGRVHAVRSQP